jgi:hypothetical protein
MAQCDAPPAVVLFFCERAAPVGGTTPIIQSHIAASYLRAQHSGVAARLAELGVRYVRVMPAVTDASSALGKSWKHSLRVETADEAEAVLAALGSTWCWLGGRGAMLRTVTKAMPALLCDARTGKEVFFTAAESTFNAVEDEHTPINKHATAADADSAADADAANDVATAEAAPCTARPLKAIIYGDGSPLDEATRCALHDVSRFMSDAQVAVLTRLDSTRLDLLARHAHDAQALPRLEPDSLSHVVHAGGRAVAAGRRVAPRQCERAARARAVHTAAAHPRVARRLALKGGRSAARGAQGRQAVRLPAFALVDDGRPRAAESPADARPGRRLTARPAA